MKFSVSDIIKQIGNFFKKLGKGVKIAIISFLVLAILGAVIIAVIMNQGKYSVLYRGLSSTEGAQVISYLEQNSVQAKVQDDGTILVPTEKVAELRMQLAAEGYPNGSLGYDLFTEQSDLLTTDYEKKKLLIFQLQDRLQDSIVTLQGVQNAIVTLSIPDDNSYVLKDEEIETTASVVLELSPYAELSKKQITGIEQLVANSVPGLEPENVAIIGSDGEQLNVINDDDTVDTDLRIETINMINTIYAQKIEQFLEPVFGKNSMSVAVNVTVDFKTVTSEETVYTPVIGENGIISWVQRTRDISGSNDEGNGTDIPTYEESVEVSDPGVDISETFSAEYLVNKLVQQIQDNGGNITDVTVAVILNRSDLSDEEKEKYKELIAYSAGITVDKVALMNAKFITESTPEETSDSDVSGTGLLSLNIDLDQKDIIILAAGVIGFIIVLVLVLLLIRKIKKKKKKKLAALEAEMKKREEDNDEASEEDGENKKKNLKMPGEIVLNETREQALKRQIKEFSQGNPETVAQLLRVWIREDEEQ